jgi:hypothetical protein
MVIGVGVGLASPSLTSAALAAVPAERSGMASGLVNTARQLGLAFGVAILGTLFTARAADSLRTAQLLGVPGMPGADDVAQAVSGGQSAQVLASTPVEFRGHLETGIHDAFASGLHGAFLLAGGLGVLGAGVCYLLMRGGPTGSEPADPKALRQAAV